MKRGIIMWKCVNATDCENLTLGKLYNMFGICGNGYYVIKDDSNHLVAYHPHRFKLIEN